MSSDKRMIICLTAVVMMLAVPMAASCADAEEAYDPEGGSPFESMQALLDSISQFLGTGDNPDAQTIVISGEVVAAEDYVIGDGNTYEFKDNGKLVVPEGVTLSIGNKFTVKGDVATIVLKAGSMVSYSSYAAPVQNDITVTVKGSLVSDIYAAASDDASSYKFKASLDLDGTLAVNESLLVAVGSAGKEIDATVSISMSPNAEGQGDASDPKDSKVVVDAAMKIDSLKVGPIDNMRVQGYEADLKSLSIEGYAGTVKLTYDGSAENAIVGSGTAKFDEVVKMVVKYSDTYSPNVETGGSQTVDYSFSAAEIVIPENLNLEAVAEAVSEVNVPDMKLSATVSGSSYTAIDDFKATADGISGTVEFSIADGSYKLDEKAKIATLKAVGKLPENAVNPNDNLSIDHVDLVMDNVQVNAGADGAVDQLIQAKSVYGTNAAVSCSIDKVSGVMTGKNVKDNVDIRAVKAEWKAPEVQGADEVTGSFESAHADQTTSASSIRYVSLDAGKTSFVIAPSTKLVTVETDSVAIKEEPYAELPSEATIKGKFAIDDENKCIRLISGDSSFLRLTVPKIIVDGAAKATFTDVTALNGFEASSASVFSGNVKVPFAEGNVITVGNDVSMTLAECAGCVEVSSVDGKVSALLLPAVGYTAVPLAEAGDYVSYTVEGAKGVPSALNGNFILESEGVKHKVTVGNEAIEAVYGQKIDLPVPPEKENSRFIGWTDGNRIYNGVYYAPNGDASLSESWASAGTFTVDKDSKTATVKGEGTSVYIDKAALDDIKSKIASGEVTSVILSAGGSFLKMDADAVNGFDDGIAANFSSYNPYAEGDFNDAIKKAATYSVDAFDGAAPVHDLAGKVSLGIDNLGKKTDSVAYYIDDAGRFFDVPLSFDAGKAYLSLDHLSDYAVVGDDASSPSGGSGDNSMMWIAIALILIIILALIAYFVLKKRKSAA